jgi:CRP-like cAMP-binding protein
MRTTLSAAKAEARRLHRAGDHARALRAYEQILAAVPLEYEVRFKIADLLAAAGLVDQAAEVYRTVALHDIRTGHPLPAIVACDCLEKLGRPADDVRQALAATYASGSPQLARFAVRQAPVDPATPVNADLAATDPLDKAAARARARSLDLSAYASYQEQFHPLPFFSELKPDAFLAVMRQLRVQRLGDGEIVLLQGDPGTALYLVASGELRVFTIGESGEREIARLFENTLFGEMALITQQPRSASVGVVDEADVIEVSREALARVTAQIPAIAQVLDAFARERLIRNLLQTSPLFTPFTKAQQTDLLRKFEGADVDAGTEVIKEGEQGPGLFVVLAGELDVVGRRGGKTEVKLGKLGPGDIFGEMSLVTQQPTSATVRACTRGTLLFLARQYVERLAAAIPEVEAYFEQVAMQRARDNTVKLAPPLGAAPKEPVDVDLSDVLLI